MNWTDNPVEIHLFWTEWKNLFIKYLRLLIINAEMKFSFFSNLLLNAFPIMFPAHIYLYLPNWIAHIRWTLDLLMIFG